MQRTKECLENKIGFLANKEETKNEGIDFCILDNNRKSSVD